MISFIQVLFLMNYPDPTAATEQAAEAEHVATKQRQGKMAGLHQNPRVEQWVLVQ